MNRKLTIYTNLVKAYIQTHNAYRLGAVLWIINGFITPVIMMTIWLFIRQVKSLPVTENQIISYYLLNIVVIRLTQSWISERLIDVIKEGSLSIILIKPVNYLIYQASFDTATRIIRILSLVPFIIFYFIFFGANLTLSNQPHTWVIFTFAVIGGYYLNFQLQNIVGLTAFWLEQAYGAHLLFGSFKYLFSGYLIPLTLMPEFLQNITTTLPFRFIISFPIEILISSFSQTSITSGFISMIAWLLILSIAGKVLYKLGIKKYTAVGI